MAFNSNTYRANKYCKDAAKALANAREIKARAAAGDAYDWEVPLIRSHVRAARGLMHMSFMYRSLRRRQA